MMVLLRYVNRDSAREAEASLASHTIEDNQKIEFQNADSKLTDRRSKKLARTKVTFKGGIQKNGLVIGGLIITDSTDISGRP